MRRAALHLNGNLSSVFFCFEGPQERIDLEDAPVETPQPATGFLIAQLAAVESVSDSFNCC